MSRRQSSSAGHQHWDPYALASESGTEDNTEDDNLYFAGDAQVRPMGSLYAATSQRPGALQINRPATSHPQEQLMYAPRTHYTPYVNPPQEQQHLQESQRRLQESQRPLSSRGNSARLSHYDGSVAGYATYGNDDGIGVGVMIPGHEQEENMYQTSSSSLPQEPYSDLMAQQRPPVTSRPMANPQNLPSLKVAAPPLPKWKPVEPVAPTPRRSKRYLKTAVRVPDIAQGRISSQSVGKGEHVVVCEACQTSCQVSKTSVLMKCPKCRHVSSATPSRMKSALLVKPKREHNME